MKPYQERFIKEYFELKDRTEKLGNMLSAYLADELDFTPTCGYNMLHEQYVYMKNYLDVLERRAIIECIDLKKEN
jgi:hypothetical protein